jgi:hypothetical protein
VNEKLNEILKLLTNHRNKESNIAEIANFGDLAIYVYYIPEQSKTPVSNRRL